jgi:hypothetical protein
MPFPPPTPSLGSSERTEEGDPPLVTAPPFVLLCCLILPDFDGWRTPDHGRPRETAIVYGTHT